MSQYLADSLRRGQSGVGQFSINENLKDLKVSKTTEVDLSARDAIEAWRRTPYMECYVIAADKTYRLGSDITIVGQVWTEVLYADPDTLLHDDILDADGYIKPALIRNLFINDSFVVASEAAMLALVTLTGNAVIRTDTGEVFIKLNNDDPSDITDFADITANTGAVTSVNGLTGAVSITIANLLAVGANLTAFNNAVAANSLVLSHSASIASLSTNKADLVGGTVPLAQLPYVVQSGLTRTVDEVKLGGNLLYDTTIGVSTFNFVVNAASGKFGINVGSDAAYDLLGRGSDGYLYRIPKGTDGQVLKMSGGLIVWGSDIGGSSSSTLSGLTAATATNTINNTSFSQTWEWNNLTGDALTLSVDATTSLDGSKVLNVTRAGAHAASDISTSAAVFSNNHTGTDSLNRAVVASANDGNDNIGVVAVASGNGVNSNIALYGEAGGNGSKNIGIRGAAYGDIAGINVGGYFFGQHADASLGPGTAGIVVQNGNVVLFHDFSAYTLPDYQDMENGMFVGNSLAVPTAAPAGGAFLYAEGGRLKIWESIGAAPFAIALVGDGSTSKFLRADATYVNPVHARTFTVGVGAPFSANLEGSSLDGDAFFLVADTVYVLEVSLSCIRSTTADGFGFRILTTILNDGGTYSIIGTNDVFGGGSGGAISAVANVIVSGGATLLVEVSGTGGGTYANTSVTVRIVSMKTL